MLDDEYINLSAVLKNKNYILQHSSERPLWHFFHFFSNLGEIPPIYARRQFQFEILVLDDEYMNIIYHLCERIIILFCGILL